MQAVYAETGEALGNPRAAEWFRTTNAFFASDRARFKETLLRNVRKAETVLLPALEKGAASSAVLIAKYSDAAQ
jgi:hypothetical protein